MPVKLNSSGGGSVTLTTPSTASDFTQTLPAGNGTILTTAGVTTPVEFAAGTAALPSITTTGDTNTGIFFPAADTIAFSTAGTEDFRIGSAGQLGVQGANYGTAGQVLTSGGAAAAPSWATVSSTGALKNVQVFTSSGTYTRTAGVTTAVVIAVGGGGGGRGASSASITAGTNGSAGGTTSFGSHVSAAGGSGGNGARAPGAGGTGGTGATIAIKGDPGSTGTADSTSGTTACGGSGGGQGGGVGGENVSGAVGVRGGGGAGGAYDDGGETKNPGGGGGQGETCIKYTTTVGATETVTIGAGGAGGSSTRNGGAGGAGYIIVYEYS